jgi:hypothetical protein
MSETSGVNSSLNQLSNLKYLPKLKVANTAKSNILSSQIISFVVGEIKKNSKL